MSHILVLGLSGQVGIALLPKLLQRQFQLTAISRRAQPGQAGVDYLQGSLQAMPPIPPDIDTVLSLGPLDAFASWFAQSSLQSVRVIALGSSGIHSKAMSPDAADRALAERLHRAETSLIAAANSRIAGLTILRPTLIYGHGMDHSLTPLLAFARRWRFLPLPWQSGGLRQPVHVDDVAQAVLACLDEPQSQGRCFDLPGGETLRLEQMIARVLARHAPGCLQLRCPVWCLRLAMMLWPFRRESRAGMHGFLARWQQDQLFDPGPAQAILHYQARQFMP